MSLFVLVLLPRQPRGPEIRRFEELIDMNLFACRIASLRHEAGLTQKELAQRCCVTSQAVSKWEHGISCPDIMILDELADALHVSLQHLLAGR